MHVTNNNSQNAHEVADIPVIAIDGPSASGKGTVAARVATALSWHYLDSGALYRLTALAAREAGVAWNDESGVAKIAAALAVHFSENEIYLNEQEVSDKIRHEEISLGASEVAAFALVRAALLKRQHDFRQNPGLVADGRDMASVVFPNACVKVFLTASVQARAERRYKQLNEKGIPANLDTLLLDLKKRDERDSQRKEAPLQAAPGARFLDTTKLSIDEAVSEVLLWHRQAVA